MFRNIPRAWPLSLAFLFLLAPALALASAGLAGDSATPAFSSPAGQQRAVSFDGVYLTTYQSAEEIRALSGLERKTTQKYVIEPDFAFVFGPLVNRSLGDPQKGRRVKLDWEHPIQGKGGMLLPFHYEGVWLIRADVVEEGKLVLPFPYNGHNLYTPNWKSCTDSDPGHQTPTFYWYFWDPLRPGCDQNEGTHYQKVAVSIGAETENLTRTYPEYAKLLQSNGKANNFQLTFGFGYAEDPAIPHPEADDDLGAQEYRRFLQFVRGKYGRDLQESNIFQAEYANSTKPDLVIGRRFQGEMNGVMVTLNVVINAGIEQMDIFAKSFAHDYDGFFAWLGHSRVGGAFDSEHFGALLATNPDYYKVSPHYQIIYWGGCSSYAYYTLPFFDFKAHVAAGADPHGTIGLDIIANGLPSYFSRNAGNAEIVLTRLLNWQARPSYQEIMGELERGMTELGAVALVSVLGDEDNPR